VYEELRERFAASAFHSGSGMELERVEDGEVDVAIDLRRDHLNLQGTAHGGVLATLADTAMGIAYRTVLEPGSAHLTSTLSIAFLAAGGPGRVVARGRVVKRGRRFGYAEADVLDARGELLARATSTFTVLSGVRRPSSPTGAD
jgi:uncharacterized protein (TIGR00369 family)